MTCPATITVDGRDHPCLLVNHRFSHRTSVPVPYADKSGRVALEVRSWDEIGDPR